MVNPQHQWLQGLELHCNWENKFDTKESDGDMFDQIFWQTQHEMNT